MQAGSFRNALEHCWSNKPVSPFLCPLLRVTLATVAHQDLEVMGLDIPMHQLTAAACGTVHTPPMSLLIPAGWI